MTARRIFATAAILFVVCLAIALSPLTDSDTGWRNAVGDVVWTGMFVALPVAIVSGVATAVRSRQSSSPAIR